MIEPENVNPSLYYVPWYRNRFSKIFTWDVRLLYRHPDYIPINVLVGAEPTQYRENRFSKLSFADKKPLVAVSRNLWSYMPQSNYGVRRRAYSYFDRHWPESFDLFGTGWNEPVGPFDRYLGYPRYRCYRGPIVGSWNEKVAQLAKYRFALCFENNASQPGYISEKITDCLCARCVPIYYGSNGTEHRIPETCWIDARRFRSYAELDSFLRTITDRDYDEYIKSIDRFMGSTDLDFFSTDFTFNTLVKGLGLSGGGGRRGIPDRGFQGDSDAETEFPLGSFDEGNIGGCRTA